MLKSLQKVILFCLPMLFLVLKGIANPIPYPKASPAFTIDFPDGWTVTQRDGETLNAISPDKASEIILWRIKSADMASVKSNAASYVSPRISDYESTVVSNFYRDAAGIHFSCFFGQGKLKSNGRLVRTAIAFYPVGSNKTVYGIGRISNRNNLKINRDDLDFLEMYLKPIAQPLR